MSAVYKLSLASQKGFITETSQDKGDDKKFKIVVDNESHNRLLKAYSTLASVEERIHRQNPDHLAYLLGMNENYLPAGYKLIKKLYEDEHFMREIRYQSAGEINKYLSEKHSPLVAFLNANNLVADDKIVASGARENVHSEASVGARAESRAESRNIARNTNVVENKNVATNKNVARNENVLTNKNYEYTKNFQSVENVNRVHKVVAVAHYAVAIVAATAAGRG